MKRKLIAAITCTCYFFLLVTGVIASEMTVSHSTSNNAYVISKETFSQVFSGPKSEIAVMSVNENTNLATTVIELSDVYITETQLSCTAIVELDNTSVSLPIVGDLAQGCRYQNGINSIIVEVDGQVNGYSVLLFEIFNDTAENALLLYDEVSSSQSLAGTRHIKLYLEDSNGMIYLFEAPMPSTLRSLNAADYPVAEKNKDCIFWISDLVEHTLTRVPHTLSTGDNGVTTRALGSFSLWINDESYIDTFYSGGTKILSMSHPFVEHKHVNVGSSDSTWIASFKVAESTRFDDEVVYGNNAFRYSNLSISFGCGDNSTFIRTYREGEMYRETFWDPHTVVGLGATIAVTSLQKVYPALPYISTILDVLNNLNSMTSTAKSVTLGSQDMSLFSNYTVCVGECTNNLFYEEHSSFSNPNILGDYFTYHAVLQSEGATVTTDTTGILKIKFDVIYGIDLLEEVEATVELPYTVYAN